MPRCLLLLLLAVPAAALAQDARPVSDKARDAALAKAFGYLDDALWKLRVKGSPRQPFSVATAAWATLVAGKPGRRAKELQRMLRFLDRYVDTVHKQVTKGGDAPKRRLPPGAPPGFSMPSGEIQFTWPLGVIAHVYAECIARGVQSRQARKQLALVLDVLRRTQQTNGGWGHDDARLPGMGVPEFQLPKEAGGGSMKYPATLLAASHIALSGYAVGLKALRKGDKTSLAKGRCYFTTSQNGDGSWPYDPSQRHGTGNKDATEVARTSGAVFALLCAGAKPGDKPVRDALALVDAETDKLSEGHGSSALGLMFGALLARGRAPAKRPAKSVDSWQVFRAAYFGPLLGVQAKTGAFSCYCRGKAFGVTNDTEPLPGVPVMPGFDYVRDQKVYVTAIYALILALDRNRPKATPTMPKLVVTK